jgi:hypothetical protein
MTTERSCEERLALLRAHLAAQFDAYERAGACFVVTPFLRHDNDPVTLRIDEDEDGRLLITDGGETIDYLRLSGYTVRRNAPFRKQMHAIGQSFGVKVEDEEISLEADEHTIADALASVARAAQHASYLIYRRRPRTPLKFDERVEVELIGVGASYERDFTVQGHTRPASFRFFVNSVSQTLLQPLSGTSRASLNDKAERLMFHILDVRAATPRYSLVPVLDDVGRAAELWESSTVSALEEYSDGVIRWSSESRRAALVEALKLPVGP